MFTMQCRPIRRWISICVVAMAALLLSASCAPKPGADAAILLRGVVPDSLYRACLQMLDHRDDYKTNRPELSASSTVYLDFGASLDGQPVPQEVVSLSPSRVILGRSYVSIVFSSGFRHLELRGYARGKGPADGETVPPDHRKVVDGLWLVEQ